MKTTKSFKKKHLIRVWSLFGGIVVLVTVVIGAAFFMNGNFDFGLMLMVLILIPVSMYLLNVALTGKKIVFHKDEVVVSILFFSNITRGNLQKVYKSKTNNITILTKTFPWIIIIPSDSYIDHEYLIKLIDNFKHAKDD